MPTGRLHVKDWPEDQRPRERLAKLGARELALSELLAILFVTGAAGHSSVDLAKHFIVSAADERVDGTDENERALRFLAQAHAGEVQLTAIPGIGPAKAATLLAAVELGRRMADLPPTPQVTGPADAARLAEEALSRQAIRKAEQELAGRDREYACILLLDTKHRVAGIHPVAMGTLNEVAIHPRDVFRMALLRGQHAVILAHNHPSGDPTPSQADLALTRRLVEAGRLMGIELVDHLIVGKGRTLSLRSLGHFG